MSYTALYWSPAVFGEIHEVHPGIPSFKTWRTAWSLLLMKRIWRTVVYSCDPHCFPPSQKSTALSPKDSQRTHRLPKLTVPQVALPRNRWGGLVFCLVWCVDMLFVFRAIYSKQCIYIYLSNMRFICSFHMSHSVQDERAIPTENDEESSDEPVAIWDVVPWNMQIKYC